MHGEISDLTFRSHRGLESPTDHQGEFIPGELLGKMVFDLSQKVATGGEEG